MLEGSGLDGKEVQGQQIISVKLRSTDLKHNSKVLGSHGKFHSRAMRTPRVFPEVSGCVEEG